jgi:hypothetical protein
MAEDKKLPELVTKAMEASIESDAKMSDAGKELTNQMKIFSDSNKAFAKTSAALNQFAKSQLDNINPFKKIKDGFDKSFVGQKLIQIRHEKSLAETAGITRDELRLLKANKEFADAQYAQAAALKASMEEYGLNVNAFFNKKNKLTEVSEGNGPRLAQNIVNGIREIESDNNKNEIKLEKPRLRMVANLAGGLDGISAGVDSVKSGLYDVKAGFSEDNKVFSDSVTKAIIGAEKGNKAVEAENKAEQAVVAAEQQTALESISLGMKSMGKSLLEGLKGLGRAGGMGVGMLFGIIAAPVIALVGFFKSLSAEFAFLNKVFKGNLTKPFVKAIEFIKDLGSKFGKIFSPKNVPWEKITKPVNAAIDFIKGIGAKIGSLFNGTGKIGQIFSVISKGFAPIAKFASTFGRILGKLFLPVTIIMGIVDTVTGFMEGYEEGGILGGILGGIEGLLSGLIMKPLDLLKDAVSWIAGKLGFENFAAMLDSFSFEEMFSLYMDGLQNLLRSIGKWFSDKIDWLKGKFGFETEKDKEEQTAVDKNLKEIKAKEKINLDAIDAALAKKNAFMAEARSTGKGFTTADTKDLAELEAARRDQLARIKSLDDQTYVPIEQKPAQTRGQIEGKGTESGIGAGVEIGGRSSSQAASSAVVSVVTNAPTTVNAPSSTSMNSQTMLSVSPGRNRTVNQARRGRPT